jgi:hypothetical protein
MASAVRLSAQRVKAWLESEGFTVFERRDESDMLDMGEMKCINLDWGGAELTSPDVCDAFLWDCEVSLDCWAKIDSAAGVSAFDACDELVAQVGSHIGSDQQLNGAVQRCVPTAVSGPTEKGNDAVAITISLSVQVWVAQSDWTSIT